MPNCKGSYVEGVDHGGRFRAFFEKKKELSIKSRIETMILNRTLRKGGHNPILVETVYTIRIFADELKCNYNSLRKFLCKKGKLPIEVLGSLEFLESSDEVKKTNNILLDIPIDKVCECGQVHITTVYHTKLPRKPRIFKVTKDLAAMIVYMKFLRSRET